MKHLGRKLNSIQMKIGINFIVIITLSLSLFGIYRYHEIKISSTAELNTFAKVTADKAAGYLAGPIWNMDSPLIEKTVTSAMIEKSIYAVVIRENDGTFFRGRKGMSIGKSLMWRKIYRVILS